MRHQTRPSLVQIMTCRLVSAPSQYLNQWCVIVNWSLRKKLQSNCIQNSNIFIHENAFENVVRKMLAIWSRPQCVYIVIRYIYMADSRLAASQWETSLKSNAVSYWLGTNLESALIYIRHQTDPSSSFKSHDPPGIITSSGLQHRQSTIWSFQTSSKSNIKALNPNQCCIVNTTKSTKEASLLPILKCR